MALHTASTTGESYTELGLWMVERMDATAPNWPCFPFTYTRRKEVSNTNRNACKNTEYKTKQKCKMKYDNKIFFTVQVRHTNMNQT